MFDDLFHWSYIKSSSTIPSLTIDQIQQCENYSIANSTKLYRIYCVDDLFGGYDWEGNYEKLRINWFEYVKSNPVEYAVFRAKIFLNFSGALGNKPIGFYTGEIPHTDTSFNYHQNSIHKFNTIYVIMCSIFFPFLFKPFFWLILASFLLKYQYIHESRDNLRLVLFLNISSILNIISLFFILPANDFRFVYWSCIATTLSAIISVPHLKRSLHSMNFNFKKYLTLVIFLLIALR